MRMGSILQELRSCGVEAIPCLELVVIYRAKRCRYEPRLSWVFPTCY